MRCLAPGPVATAQSNVLAHGFGSCNWAFHLSDPQAVYREREKLFHAAVILGAEHTAFVDCLESRATHEMREALVEQLKVCGDSVMDSYLEFPSVFFAQQEKAASQSLGGMRRDDPPRCFADVRVVTSQTACVSRSEFLSIAELAIRLEALRSNSALGLGKLLIAD